MRHLFLSLAVLTLAAPAAHADNADHAGFTGIDAQGAYRVEVAVGDRYGVTVTGPDASAVSVRNEGQTLQLRQIARNSWFGGSHRLNAIVHITTPTLTSVDTSRGMEFSADGIHADQFDVHGAMGTEIRLSGSCGALTLRASMGADIDARRLDCASADVDARMGADVHVHARESASATASMGGDVLISGNPPRREHHAGLGGAVEFN